jgi:hypothetical protein
MLHALCPMPTGYLSKVIPMNNFLDRHHKYLRYLLVLSFITLVILVAATSAQGANCLSVDGVSSGTTVADTTTAPPPSPWRKLGR